MHWLPPPPTQIFLVLLSVRGWVDPRGHSAARRIMSMKKFQWHHQESNPQPSKPTGTPCKHVDYWHSRWTVWIISPLCELCASNICVTVTLSRNKWASDSDSNTVSVLSWSIKFYPHSHTAKCTSSQLRTQQTQHLLTLFVIQASAVPGLLHAVTLRGKGLKCSVESRHKREPTVKNSHNEIRRAEWRIFGPCSQIALTRAINICIHPFPLPPIAYELIRHSTQINTHYHKT